MEKRKAAVKNLGCKVNFYEAKQLENALLAAGFTLVDFSEWADAYIVNTCSVTTIADKKSRQLLHRARELNPKALVVAAGCYADTGKDALIKDGAADMIIGNESKAQIPQLLLEKFGGIKENETKEARKDVSENTEIPGASLPARTRAFLKAQDGCNRFCSYCIIPHARGRVTSRSIQELVSESAALAAEGYQEIVVTGIHISSYENGLAALLESLSEIEGLKRIRLSSLEPTIVSEDFARRISRLEKLCPHFHLSLQSGCDETLKRMNRHYNTEEYLKAVERLRLAFPHPAITTDVIAGFPGETDEEFEESLRFCEEVGFYQMHVFPYSKRKGTPAERMPGQLSNAVKAKRAQRLRLLTKAQEKEFLQACLGSKMEILIEENNTIDGDSYFTGHTREYVPAALAGEYAQGQIVTAKAERILPDGTLVCEEV
ncbi:MAG: tRNA (N(6)-L-threonylcarbamoyladenosine(37)-C(2))-methylthiotransferase MtaB [Lachnospiraceae bacterium]|nr:tRNA (N(6)-L-threonylcarbamoyladenosine(37)-C(2))-methylthiotransferase MtaB [Lachnospiraceae bacterium]